MLSVWRRMMAVLCGGFCGAITRYLLGMLIQGYLGKAWPYDIFFINITGALVLALITVLADATFLIGPTRRLFINVGFLGAYTTFSSLALGDVLLFAQGAWFLALLYLFSSLLGGILAVWLGDWLGQWCIRHLRRAPAQTSIPLESKGAEAQSFQTTFEQDVTPS
ncbi:fluoride efflux transporter CrcB [Ktedonosporobacter rubrisoli]|uniref:Fluoride-specific ion channel FluC n=1 Tax=Ktedonosporobacter rubrisoli TaxID=2509675 RepID=A0A4P6K343_KTERU|nr:fluoride efflux transporter CrcB [Ktedonosporobacter rubrisoli]QBD82658.1 fluoride efflux transporter CrcB [Ktedonosporobacter rubrisoli]